jgi:D-3-phosphoglycerate dehydrogenase / 2-oxoglutarate reductase
MPTRVLVADQFSGSTFDVLRKMGVEVDLRPDLKAETLPAAIRGARILVVRSLEVSKTAIDAADNLALIVRAGSGTNTIDVKAASGRGVYVSNCPGRNSVAVAELAMGLIAAIDRRIVDNVVELRQGAWNKGTYSKAMGLKGRQLGLVGFGSIGREVAHRARAFGLRVMVYSRSLTDERATESQVVRARSLEEIFASSDIVSLHLPLTSETRGLVSKALLESMKKDAVLINTARAEVVDSEALYALAKSGRIRVGTDVYAKEPEGRAGKFEDPLGVLPNVYGTHHIGASTEQAQTEIALATVQIIRRFLETGEVENAVNILYSPPVQGTLVVRHLDRIGVLASVLSTLKTAEINVETMENVIFAGGTAACARIRVAQRPTDDVIRQVNALENVIHAELI